MAWEATLVIKVNSFGYTALVVKKLFKDFFLKILLKRFMVSW